MNSYRIFKFISGTGWVYQHIEIKARDCYKAEAQAIKKFKLEGIYIAMNESMLLLNDCIR